MDRLEATFLPAREGDAIWIRWGDGHQMLIDMGRAETGRGLIDRLRALPVDARSFELLVITHVDRDHIEGVLTVLVDNDEPIDGLTFGDVWFNGWEHLDGKSVAMVSGSLEPWSTAQGQTLGTWLEGRRWNGAFEGGPVKRGDDSLPVRDFADGLTVTVLGPTQEKLTALKPEWQPEVAAAMPDPTPADEQPTPPGLEAMGSKTPPILDEWDHLEELADTKNGRDTESNGSSIAFVLEWRGIRLLLGGDAHAEDLVTGLGLYEPAGRVTFDAVKLPHHGSRNNVTDELVHAIDTPNWVFSTDGTQFRHPDAAAIARILRARGGGRIECPTLVFNVASTYNGWWNDELWRDRFQYQTLTGTKAQGITLAWPARPG